MSAASIGRVFLAVFFVLAASLAPGLGAAMPVAAANHVGQQSATTTAGSDIGDAYVSSQAPATNFGSATSLLAKPSPAEEAYMAFDTAAYKGQKVVQATLVFNSRQDVPAGTKVYRLSMAWSESSVTWNTKPGAGAFVTSLSEDRSAGTVTINVLGAFPSGAVDAGVVSLRLTTSSSNGLNISSREGAAPPRLVLKVNNGAPVASASPTPTPTPTPTAKPTSSASPTPTPKPSATPTPTPVATPTPTPTPSPTSSTQLLSFTGRGSDHGVGMSQYGAYGRAMAGQTYTQILGAYYTGTTIGTISSTTRVRVLLAFSYVPTSTTPARITARNGGWQSAAFVDSLGIPVLFPANSYVDMVPAASGWHADVYDSNGNLLRTRQLTDITIKPASSATLMEIKWRDSEKKYTLVRGSMRLLVNGSGVEAINSLSMDDYLRAVVPAEMPASWAIEALKTQTVAARSYSYLRLKPANDFDVKQTSANQVYSGYAHERASSNLAVSATSGQVVMYSGHVANAFFFAISGGATENNEDVWGVTAAGKITASPIPYLRGVSDVAPNGVAYDSMAKKYAWASGTFTMSQLSDILSRDSRTAVGTVSSIKFDRGFSGRIYRATIVGSSRTVYVSGSIFKAVYNTNRLSGPALNSAMFWLGPAA